MQVIKLMGLHSNHYALVANEFVIKLLDLHDAKELKHCSFSMLPRIYTIAIFANLKYFRGANGIT